MSSIKASDFKARCLKLMDEVARTGEEVIITKSGRPVARLVPYRRRPTTLFGIHRSRLTMNDDLTEPTGERWEAEHD